MSIVTTIKHAVESWISAIVSDEVSALDTSLRSERAAFDSQIHSFRVQFDLQLAAFDLAVKHLIEVSNHSQENIALKDTISKFVANSAEVIALTKKLHRV
jgi:hypothetical protein